MKIKQYIADAFTDKVFSGNPAAVCVLENWISDELALSIAKENNLSETAFIVEEGDRYRLRWFTPGGEIDLCGHATLASAYVLLKFYRKTSRKILFDTKSGELSVTEDNGTFKLNMPAYDMKRTDVTEKMTQTIGFRPKEAWLGRDLVCVLENERMVLDAKPNLEQAKELDGLLLHITAQGDEFDCVSRSFAPKLSVPEDPVCGSGHCHIAPLWSAKLNKKDIVARQASQRGGTLYCSYNFGDSVTLSGKVALYSVGELFLDSDI